MELSLDDVMDLRSRERFVRAETPDELEQYYRLIMPVLVKAGREVGYCIAGFGSFRRDLDLIAAPWVADHCDRDTLARALQSSVSGIVNEKYIWGHEKPCGRTGTVFAIGFHAVVDLQLMPDTSEFITDSYWG